MRSAASCSPPASSAASSRDESRDEGGPGTQIPAAFGRLGLRRGTLVRGGLREPLKDRSHIWL